MRYRALSPSGDFVFGPGSRFLIDSPATVGQAVRTRLLLALGEWFLDMTEGTPYKTSILGTGTKAIYDQAIQERILGTQGVTSIESYASFLDEDRHLSVAATINTIYGQTTVNQVF